MNQPLYSEQIDELECQIIELRERKEFYKENFDLENDVEARRQYIRLTNAIEENKSIIDEIMFSEYTRA
jgi:hypothetical protein